MTAATGIMRSDLPGFVYFVRPGQQPFVKIGWAQSPSARLVDLQCGNPEKLALVGTIAGTMVDELGWHKRFRHLAVRSEWFHLTDELIDAIERRELVAETIWAERQPLDMPETWQRYKDHLTERRSRFLTTTRSILTEDQIPAIRSDRRAVRTIAAHYGVSKTCVQDIRMRKTWRHVA